MQKLFNFLILCVAKLIVRVITSSWYRESVRVSGLSERKFAFNALLSLAMLFALGIAALVVH